MNLKGRVPPEQLKTLNTSEVSIFGATIESCRKYSSTLFDARPMDGV